MSPDPELSISIATHAGRRDHLRRLLESIRASLAASGEEPSVLQVSIHDNASDDGTEEMVTELRASLPFEVTYGRFAENRGLVPNLIAAMRNARGRHAWTFGSDDLVAPGGIAIVLGALRRDPELTGLVVGSIDVDPDDERLRSRQPAAAFFPEPRRFTVFTDVDEILDQCGNSWGSLSWTIQHRERWLASVGAREPLMHANPVFPQTIAEAGAALDHPRWGWEPGVAVHRRGADPFVFESGNVSMAAKWAQLLGACCDAWAAVLGGRNRRWRRRVARVQLVWGRAEDVRATKLYERPALADQLELARAWTRSLWPTRAYWREVLPALLSPIWLTRRLHGHERAPKPRPPKPGREIVRLGAELPARLERGAAPTVAVEVRNVRSRVLAGSGPAAIGVWQRWRRQGESAHLSWDELGVNEVGSQPVDLGRRLLPGASATVELALMAPREPGSYELTISAHRHGVGWLDAAGATRPITATVEVT